MQRKAALLLGCALAVSMAAWALERSILRSLFVAAALAAAVALLLGMARWISLRFQGDHGRHGTLAHRPGRMSLGMGFVAAFASYLLFVVWAHFMVTRSAAYGMAVKTAHQSAEFAKALGPPVAEGWFVDSQFTYGNPEVAVLEIPVRGRTQEGLLRATAINSNEGWELTELVLEVARTRETISLLRPLPAPEIPVQEGGPVRE